MSQVDIKFTYGDTHRCKLPIALFQPTSATSALQAPLLQRYANDATVQGELAIRISGAKHYVPLDLKQHGALIVEQRRARLRFTPANSAADAATHQQDALLQAFLHANNDKTSAQVETEAVKPRMASQADREAAMVATEPVKSVGSATQKTAKSKQETGELSQVLALLADSNVTIAENAAQLAKIQQAINHLTALQVENHRSQKEQLTQLMHNTDMLMASSRAGGRPVSGNNAGGPTHGHFNHPPHYHAHSHGYPHGSMRDGSSARPESAFKHYTKDLPPFRHNAVCDNCDGGITGARFKCLTCPDFDLCNGCYATVSLTHPTHRFVRITDDGLLPHPASASAIKARVTHTGVLCDGPGCGARKSAITGPRFKCAVCPDFDLCAACETHPLLQHDATHPLVKFKTMMQPRQVQAMVAPVKARVAAEKEKESEKASAQAQTAKKQAGVPVKSKADTDHVKEQAPVAKVINKLLPNVGLVRHFTVACDACQAMVVGDRFNCVDCPDFDLCAACFNKQGKHPDHGFVRFSRFVNHQDGRTVQANARALQVGEYIQGSAICDRCPLMESEKKDRDLYVITGRRATCLSCEDYDLCWECAQAHEHDNSHNFLITTVQAESVTQTTPEQTPTPIFETSSGTSSQSTAATAEAAAILQAEFVEDLSIPDGSVVSPGSQLVKQWTLKNTGKSAWPVGVSACFVGGAVLQPIHTERTTSTPRLTSQISPGGSAVVSVLLQAPAEVQDNVISYWRLCTADGHKFGPRLWIDVDVQQPPSSATPMTLQDLQKSAAHSSSSSQSFKTTGSRLVFPSASIELPKSDAHGALSSDASEARSQQGHNIDDMETVPSDEEIDLSDESDFELLDEDSIDEAHYEN